MVLYVRMPHTPETRERAYRKMRQNRKDFFLNKVCVKCGSNEDLELDHIDPDKKKSHNIWSWSKVKREEEISKCQVLCKKCHRKKTNEYLNKIFTKKIVHGTASGYEHKGCRCDACRIARQKERRIRKDKNGKWS